MCAHTRHGLPAHILPRLCSHRGLHTGVFTPQEPSRPPQRSLTAGAASASSSKASSSASAAAGGVGGGGGGGRGEGPTPMVGCGVACGSHSGVVTTKTRARPPELDRSPRGAAGQLAFSSEKVSSPVGATTSWTLNNLFARANNAPKPQRAEPRRKEHMKDT